MPLVENKDADQTTRLIQKLAMKKDFFNAITEAAEVKDKEDDFSVKVISGSENAGPSVLVGGAAEAWFSSRRPLGSTKDIIFMDHAEYQQTVDAGATPTLADMTITFMQAMKLQQAIDHVVSLNCNAPEYHDFSSDVSHFAAFVHLHFKEHADKNKNRGAGFQKPISLGPSCVCNKGKDCCNIEKAVRQRDKLIYDIMARPAVVKMPV